MNYDVWIGVYVGYVGKPTSVCVEGRGRDIVYYLSYMCVYVGVYVYMYASESVCTCKLCWHVCVVERVSDIFVF